MSVADDRLQPDQSSDHLFSTDKFCKQNHTVKILGCPVHNSPYSYSTTEVCYT